MKAGYSIANWLLFFVLCLVGSCSDDDGNDSNSSTPAVISLTGYAAPYSFTLNAESSWYADSDAKWLTVNPERGMAGATRLTVMPTENRDSLRSARVLIHMETGERMITVKQAHIRVLRVYRSIRELSYEWCKVFFSVECNVDYSVSIAKGSDWIRKVDNQSLNRSDLEFNLSENPDALYREGMVILKDLNSPLADTLTLIQRPNAYGPITIPDDAFRAFCLNAYDDNRDGILNYSEISFVTSLRLENTAIRSLKGIESFYNLHTLELCSNPISALDLSKNIKLKKLVCKNNRLTGLFLPPSNNLTHLSLIDEPLRGPDLTQNKKLSVLECKGISLKRLDLTAFTQLKELNCSENELTRLDLSNTPLLEMLYCFENRLGELNISGNPRLKIVDCISNPLTKILVWPGFDARQLFWSVPQNASIVEWEQK